MSQKVWHAKVHAQWPLVPSIGQNLQPFTGNGDISIGVKNSRAGRKPPNKQINKVLFPLYEMQKYFFQERCIFHCDFYKKKWKGGLNEEEENYESLFSAYDFFRLGLGCRSWNCCLDIFCSSFSWCCSCSWGHTKIIGCLLPFNWFWWHFQVRKEFDSWLQDHERF